MGLLLAALALLWGCAPKGEGDRADEKEESLSAGLQGYSSNGARIYHAGVNVHGEQIKVEGELVTPSGHSLQTCSDCHGPDARGARLAFGREPQISPGVSFSMLSAPDPPRRRYTYDEATLELTLRSGVNVDGRLLRRIMPRLKISKSDMRDLIDYLKTMDRQTGSAAPDADRSS